MARLGRGVALEAMLRPRAIAVVGASSQPGHFGYQPLSNLATFGFGGGVYGVNPVRSQILGYPCVPDISELPEGIEHAVIALRAELVPDAIVACGERGIPTATIVASGFEEVGTKSGAELQAALEDALSSSGVRICGPNSLGVADFVTGAVPIASANLPDHAPGSGVAIVSQSGGLGITILHRAVSRGIGVGQLVVAGNELDVSIPEYLEVLVGFDDVRAVLCYMEAVRDPEGLLAIAQLARESDLPLVMLKAGRSRAGQRAATAHTGALATSTVVFDGLLTEAGAAIATTIDEAIFAAGLFSRFGAAAGRRCGVYGVAGGMSVVMADLFEDAAIEMPEPASETVSALRTLLPDTMPGNPLDSGGRFLTASGEPVLGRALTTYGSDPAFDVLVYGAMPWRGEREVVYGDGLVQAIGAVDKPSVVLQYGASPYTDRLASRLREAGSLVLDPPEAGAAALSLWLSWGSVFTAAGATDADSGLAQEVRTALAHSRSIGRTMVTEHDAMSLLERLGVPVVATRKASSEDEAVTTAAEFGDPIVLKALSAQVVHRARIGALAVGISGEHSVRAAWRDISARVGAVPGAILEGMVVQPLVPAGHELLVGLHRDPQFGHVVVIGIGGTMAETIGRSVARRGPIDEEGVTALLGTLGLQMLAESDAVAGLTRVLSGLFKLQRAAGEDIVSVDLNPVIVGPAGTVAVDALIVLEQESQG